MGADRRTAYEVLGVRPDATQEQLRRAWRAAARRTHPDAGGEARAFRAVTQAWEQVGDPEARRRYDLSLGSTATGAARPSAASADSRAGAGSGTGAGTGAGAVVVYDPPPGEGEADPGVLDLVRSSQRLHGAPRARGLLPDGHRVLRQARALDLLSSTLPGPLPAVRILTGLSVPLRWGRALEVDHAVLCGHRLALVGSVMVPDGVYTWDGADLRSGARSRPVAPPLMGPAMQAWQQLLPDVTVGGFVLVMTDRDALHAPVVRHTRGASDPAAQADLLTELPAAGRDLVRGLQLFLGTGPERNLVDRRTLAVLVDHLQ
ncbi:DnaJ domain-containing protein [Micrococcus sp.]|uniref:DnaJ domain-containing protein n=1 Tax=Micrococcus sp. TaxID=1271 RepID=UPI002A918E4C|nr:DnaJ domain-containing protein [Micrococcus sp.]MDY6055885.1 DnaJ domain-containing protein [Micrococcus sp.]